MICQIRFMVVIACFFVFMLGYGAENSQEQMTRKRIKIGLSMDSLRVER